MENYENNITQDYKIKKNHIVVERSFADKKTLKDVLKEYLIKKNKYSA